MSGNLLTITASLQCPHGGVVSITSSNTHVKAGGDFAALATDTFLISGCPFQIPATPPIPSPCMTVQWLATNVKTKVGGAMTVGMGSAGMCISALQVPQGPVVIGSTQPKASGQ
jgi:hypothetical protein